MNALTAFFDENFNDEERRCARTYGCAMTGIPGLIYYADTCAIYDRFKEEVWSLVNEYGAPTALIQADDFSCPTRFENAMVWLAFEIYALQHP